jgi:hypothetical protein
MPRLLPQLEDPFVLSFPEFLLHLRGSGKLQQAAVQGGCQLAAYLSSLKWTSQGKDSAPSELNAVQEPASGAAFFDNASRSFAAPYPRIPEWLAIHQFIADRFAPMAQILRDLARQAVSPQDAQAKLRLLGFSEEAGAEATALVVRVLRLDIVLPSDALKNRTERSG